MFVNLLFVLGVLSASGKPIVFVSEGMKEKHMSIKDLLRLTEKEIGSDPLFTPIFKNISVTSEKAHLMNATLDVYAHIFSSILKDKTLLNELNNEDQKNVTSVLNYFQTLLNKLKGHVNHMIYNRDDVLHRLNTIQVDDPVNQRKALAEFLEIYQVASVISSHG